MLDCRWVQIVSIETGCTRPQSMRTGLAGVQLMIAWAQLGPEDSVPTHSDRCGLCSGAALQPGGASAQQKRCCMWTCTAACLP